MARISTTSHRPLSLAWVVWLGVLALLLASGAFLGSCQPTATPPSRSTRTHEVRAAHAAVPSGVAVSTRAPRAAAR